MSEAKSERGPGAGRPLSPHLSIYTLRINMVMSILHRMTGGALYFGTLILAWWLIAAAAGPDYFAYVSSLLGSWPGLVILFGYTWALIHHMLGGLRHFIWDTGAGFDLATVDALCWGSIAASVLLTGGIWAYVLLSTGGAGQ